VWWRMGQQQMRHSGWREGEEERGRGDCTGVGSELAAEEGGCMGVG
jgi:hypothetical protein